MGNLWIYEGYLYRQTDFASAGETEDGIPKVCLNDDIWAIRSECRLVTYEEVIEWWSYYTKAL